MASSHGATRRLIEDARRDLVSDLPANVIDDIMKRLPLRDAARLGFLSSKCRCIWLSLSHLKFDAQFFKEVLKNKQFQAHEFYSIVSKVLLYHNGTIPQFVLHIPNINSTSSPEIGPLINFLSKNGVRKLSLENNGSSPLKLPSHLFSCVDLKSLKLGYCILTVPPTFKSFKILIRLELDSVRIIKDTVGCFISSCPVLENLTLKRWHGYDHLTISAPNLKYIEVSGKFKSICLTGCQALLIVAIDLVENVVNGQTTKTRNLIEFLSSECKVKELYLRGYFLEFLAGACYLDLSKRNFEHLRKLQISNIDSTCLFSFPYTIRLLRGCPNIEHLTISFSSSTYMWKHEIASDHGRFGQLHSATILYVKGLEVEHKLIEFILTHSPVLEKLHVQRSVNITPDAESKLSRELMRFRRASPKAEIIYANP